MSSFSIVWKKTSRLLIVYKSLALSFLVIWSLQNCSTRWPGNCLFLFTLLLAHHNISMLWILSNCNTRLISKFIVLVMRITSLSLTSNLKAIITTLSFLFKVLENHIRSWFSWFWSRLLLPSPLCRCRSLKSLRDCNKRLLIIIINRCEIYLNKLVL